MRSVAILLNEANTYLRLVNYGCFCTFIATYCIFAINNTDNLRHIIFLNTNRNKHQRVSLILSPYLLKGIYHRSIGKQR